MKKLFTILAMSVLAIGTQAQTTLWSESFDSTAAAGFTVTQGAEGMDFNTTYNNTQDFFFRTSGTYLYFGSTSLPISYAGNVGDFFAAQDVDDGGWTGSASPSELTWTGINIMGYSTLTFEGLFGSVQTAKADDVDSVVIEYNIDGAGWNKLISFRNDGAQYNTNLLEDTDFDGIGDANLLDSTMTSFTKSISGAGSLLDLRITVALNSGGENIAFDEFKITGIIPTVYHPTINTVTPADGSTNVSTTTDLTMTFDTAVVAGAGMIHLYNATSSTTTDIAASSADVSISGKTVTVTNLMLDYSSDYTVLMDFDAFKQNGGSNTMGITDSTRWNFTTMDMPPVPDTLTSLNTSFEDCIAVTGKAAQFNIVNLDGPDRKWRCSLYGRSDSNCAYMSGYNSGTVEVGDDYLISPAIQGSATTNYLHFWQKRRYAGDNSIEVLYSTDYMGDGMPQNANWTSLTNAAVADSNIWSQVTNLDISAVGTDVFYIAFRYVADASTTDAYEWNIDDVFITADPVSIKTINTTGLDIALVGNPVLDGTLDLALNMDKASDLQIKLNNVMGQEVLSTSLKARAGSTQEQINVQGVASGLYLLHILGQDGGAVLKVLID